MLQQMQTALPQVLVDKKTEPVVAKDVQLDPALLAQAGLPVAPTSGVASFEEVLGVQSGSGTPSPSEPVVDPLLVANAQEGALSVTGISKSATEPQVLNSVATAVTPSGVTTAAPSANEENSPQVLNSEQLQIDQKIDQSVLGILSANPKEASPKPEVLSSDVVAKNISVLRNQRNLASQQNHLKNVVNQDLMKHDLSLQQFSGATAQIHEGKAAHLKDEGMPSVSQFESSLLDSLNVENVEVAKPQVVARPSHSLSTEAFLSLKENAKNMMANQSTGLVASSSKLPLEFEKGLEVSSLAQQTSASPSVLTSLHAVNQQQNSPVIEAPVTASRFSGQTVIQQEALNAIAQQMARFSTQPSAQELKIKLRPDHLGEIQMKLTAKGQDLAVEIKTQNPEAKRIIEDSLGALKDSLASHSIQLSKVDVQSQVHSPQPTQQGQFNLDTGGAPQRDFNFGGSQGNPDQRESFSQRSQDGLSDSGLEGVPMAAARKRAVVQDGRLDLIA